MSYDINRLHVELIAPKQNSEKLDEDLERFAAKYSKCIEAGYAASVTDNPMGHLSFQATEVIPELGLTVPPGQLLIHLNTFHTKDHLDQILSNAIALGVRSLLVISGDGSDRLPKLTPECIGSQVQTVTSVELLQYIRREYEGQFTCGVAFNPYEPQDHELEKMKRKVDAGAAFVITQPVIGDDERVHALLRDFNLPVVIDAWMSKKLHLLSDCIGYEIPPETPYDPIDNLRKLRQTYPRCGLYLALLGFKTQYPILKDLLGEPAGAVVGA